MYFFIRGSGRLKHTLCGTGKTTLISVLVRNVLEAPQDVMYLVYNLQSRLSAKAKGIKHAFTYHALAAQGICASPYFRPAINSVHTVWEEALASISVDHEEKVKAILWTLYAPENCREMLPDRLAGETLSSYSPLPFVVYEKVVIHTVACTA